MKDATREIARSEVVPAHLAGGMEITRLAVSADLTKNIEITEREDQLAENSWRRLAISFLLLAFVLLNAAVMIFTYIVWRSEVSEPAAIRIVTERVMLALIAGSVAQLGALALGLGRALTNKRV